MIIILACNCMYVSVLHIRLIRFLSFRRHPAHSVPVLIVYPSEIQALWSQNDDRDTAYFFLLSRFYFPASGQALVSGVVPSPVPCLQFLSRIGFGIPTDPLFSSNVANSRSRAFHESIHAQEKVPTCSC